jgi:hypothetical protein
MDPSTQPQMHWQSSIAPAGTNTLDITISCKDLPNSKPTPNQEGMLWKLKTKKGKERSLESLKADAYIIVRSSQGETLAITSVEMDNPNPTFPISIELEDNPEHDSLLLTFCIMDFHGSNVDEHKQIGTVTLSMAQIRQAAMNETDLEQPIQGAARSSGNGSLKLQIQRSQSWGSVVVTMAARDLPRLDLNVVTGIDAYFRLEQGNNLLYVSEVRTNRSPWWSRFSLPLKKLDPTQSLQVVVMDQDKNADDIAGRVLVEVKDVLDLDQNDNEMELDLDHSNAGSCKLQKMSRKMSKSKLVIQSIRIRSFEDWRAKMKLSTEQHLVSKMQQMNVVQSAEDRREIAE